MFYENARFYENAMFYENARSAIIKNTFKGSLCNDSNSV